MKKYMPLYRFHSPNHERKAYSFTSMVKHYPSQGLVWGRGGGVFIRNITQRLSHVGHKHWIKHLGDLDTISIVSIPD